MGYYTYYNIEIKCDRQLTVLEQEEIYATLYKKIFQTDEVYPVNFEEDSLDDAINNEIFYESMKWYSWESDMLDLTKQFPEVKFILSGDGEEYDDFWKAYYFAGKYQFARGEIVYEENCLW